MSGSLVARKEFGDALRTRTLRLVSAVFALLVVGDAYLYTAQSYHTGSAADVVLHFVPAARALVPLVGLAVGYRAVVGERASGSIKILLGLPHSRRDVVRGKLLGRCVVVALPLLASFALAAALVASQYGGFALVPFAGFVLLTLLLGVAFVALGVGVSAATATPRRAAAAAVGAFALVELFWGALVNLVGYAVTGSASMTYPLPAWAYFVQRLSPTGAYEGLVRALVSRGTVQLAGGGPAPAYLSPWVALLVVLAWAAVPLAVGARRFRNADL